MRDDLDRKIAEILARATNVCPGREPVVRAAHEVILASFGPAWDRPSMVESDLEAIRTTVSLLRRQLTALHGYARTALNQERDGRYVRMRVLRDSSDPNDLEELIRLLESPTPREQWVTVAVERELSRLSEALQPVIERTIAAGEKLNSRGRPPNWRARGVALVVAKYLRDETGRLPSLWTGSSPSGPYAIALGESFRLLDLGADIRRPGEWALSQLSKYSDF